jgi:hypothetical protein
VSSAAATSTKDTWGVVSGTPAHLLRLEAAALLAGSLLAYTTTGQPWWLVPLTFLFPDLFMIGYVAGTQVGARSYNLAHITPLPGVLIAFGWWQNASLAVALGLVWLAHIGLDRMFGFGLKYGDDFQHTHLSGKGEIFETVASG